MPAAGAISINPLQCSRKLIQQRQPGSALVKVMKHGAGMPQHAARLVIHCWPLHSVKK